MPLSEHRILLAEDEAIIAIDLKVIIHKANGEVVAYVPILTKASKLVNTPGLSLAILDFRLGSESSLPVARKLHAAGVPFLFIYRQCAKHPGVLPGRSYPAEAGRSSKAN